MDDPSREQTLRRLWDQAGQPKRMTVYLKATDQKIYLSNGKPIAVLRGQVVQKAEAAP